MQGLFSTAQFSFEFLGAANILQLARQTATTTHNLRLSENPISSGEQSFVCLVNIVEFYNFICDTEGRLQKRIFDANVRDYQGSVQVNQGIKDTLLNPGVEDFWWLNNGITMVGNRTSLSGKILTIENPLIVNGMQTSYEIYKHFSESEAKEDDRDILIRVIGITETLGELETRNRIIKATNSQTAIQVASLRATDIIQRDIEDYLKSEGFYYDRRKNYYKNARKPIDKIISITYLAQSVMTLVLRRPNDARARPSTLLKEDEDYQSVFNNAYPMQLYLRCIEVLKHVESYLHETQQLMTSTERNNFKFHLAMFSTLLLANNPEATVDEVLSTNLDDMTTDFLNDCYDEVYSVYSVVGLGSSYMASKSKESVTKLIEHLRDITYRGR